MTEPVAPDHQVLIIGAGFSGIGAAIKLDAAGLGDYLIVEAGAEAGGTWYWNTYPGIAVDIPSFSYQFSFEQSPEWTRTYAPGRELKAYADHCVAKYGIADRIRFNTAVTGAAFDADADMWRVATDTGEITAPIPHQRRRRADRSEAARHRRGRRLRRCHHAHRTLGPCAGPGRQAGRHHRHRRVRGAGHSGDRTDCRSSSMCFNARRSGASPRPTSRCPLRPDWRCAYPAARSRSDCSVRPTSR